MSLAVINIDDAGIQVSVDGDLVRTSPGIAVLDKDHLMVGEEASRHAKLLPLWTNNRFWSQLDTNPLPNATSTIRHHADLAFSHLEDLWTSIKKEADSAVFVVPGNYNTENLGLLLGIAKESGIPATSVVDRSVISASSLPLRRTVLHLDIHLHNITLTRLSNNGVLSRVSVKTVVETGLFTLWDRWANTIANQFIQSTRFDPMHDAASEQQLFDSLPGWIADLDQGTLQSFTLSTGESQSTVAVSNENLLKACTPLYPQIVQAIRAEIPRGEVASLLISHHFRGFPGLKQSLELIKEIDLLDLTELKTIGSAHLLKDQLGTSGAKGVSHIISLNAGELIDTTTSYDQLKATHLLVGHVANAVGSRLAIGEDLLPETDSDAVGLFYYDDNELVLEPRGDIKVNGTSISQVTKLKPGDLLTTATSSATVISVSGDG